ncbi:hypothetical protein GGQ17_003209 [Salinibacter ruber]|nr:hypothetical protein [Salinibacter ruber]
MFRKCDSHYDSALIMFSLRNGVSILLNIRVIRYFTPFLSIQRCLVSYIDVAVTGPPEIKTTTSPLYVVGSPFLIEVRI